MTKSEDRTRTSLALEHIAAEIPEAERNVTTALHRVAAGLFEIATAIREGKKIFIKDPTL
jgi:hypothetical protein